MTQTTARIKQGGKPFEIMVNMEKALAFKKGEGSALDFLEMDKVFTDHKRGEIASHGELDNAFNTTDINEIAEKIVKNGEVLVNQEHRDEEREKKFKQVVDFLVTNSVDPQTGNPHTAERIKRALDEAHVNLKNVPMENQIKEIISQISRIIPIKIETKKIKVIIPAIHTGKAYGVITQYKEDETWKDDGSLEVIVSVPAGILMDFFDKLNGVTHGSAITEEIKAEENGK